MNDFREDFALGGLEERVRVYSRVPHCVLITGERGTGKTTLARRLHLAGPRAKREFVNLNCAGFSENLLESELFGYERGAFTGATNSRAGLFEIAGGGTLFLDEIGELPLALQAKLLKAVEEKRIRRVGSNLERSVDARIVAATSRNLEAMVAAGEFRADLLDRLNVLNLETLPLRHQSRLILPLLNEQIRSERESMGFDADFRIADDAGDLLLAYHWPGNFRELINLAVRLAVELGDVACIRAADIARFLPRTRSFAIGAPSSRTDTNLVTVSFDPKTDDLGQIYLKAAGHVIRHHLAENGNSLRRAAQTMGATHSTLSRIMQRLKATEEAPQDAQQSDNRYRIAALQ